MRKRILKIAFRTTLFYGVIASVWILFSDWLLARFTSDPVLLEKISSYKGLVFVVVTSALLFFELRRQLERLRKVMDARQKAEHEIKVSESKFRSYVENAPVAVFVANQQGQYVDANPAATQLLGHDITELLCMGITDVVSASDRERVLRDFAELESVGHIKKEYSLLRRDGTVVLVILHAVKIAGDRLLAFCQDITALKQNEEALHHSKAEIQYIVNNTRDVIFQIDLQGNYIFGNSAAEQLTGYRLSELLQMSMWQLVLDEYHPMLRERLRRRIGGEIIEKDFEFEIRHRDGRRIWLELTTSGVCEKDGTLTAIQGVARNITNRKKVEQELNLLSFALNHVKEEAVLVNEQGRIVFVNDETCRILGYSREELLQLNISDINTDHEMADWPGHWRQLKKRGSLAFEGQHRTKAGTVIPVEIFANYFEHNGQAYNLGLMRDITERKETEQQLRKLSRAVESSSASIIITGTDGRIEYVNPKFTAVTGYTPEEVYGKNPNILKGNDTSAEEYHRLWQAITSGREWHGEFHNRKKNGELYWETASVSPITDGDGRITHFLAVKEDITKQKSLEAQFRQMQKMEAIGRLAGGVAHDFNNILAIILMQSELMVTDKNLASEQREFAHEISKAAQRGANLTRQLLMFSRRQILQPRDVDLNEATINFTKMLQRILGEDIQIQFKIAPQPLYLHADPGMLDQILMNLSVNCRDAMPRGGQLILETSAEEFDEATASQFSHARPGSFVCLSVSDTGTGISPEILPLIFDPFFTTKEAGKGTGLGLATIFSIVQQHQGWIDVYSKVGHGTTFRIFFPRLPSSSSVNPALPSKIPLPRGTETILLVEDETPLRALAKTILTQLGYRVLDAANSSIARELWEQQTDKIHLLLTDLVLPGALNGREFAEQLLKLKSGLRVLYVSGYSAEVAGQDFPLQEGVNFLAKPFHAHKLAQAVRARLDAPSVYP